MLSSRVVDCALRHERSRRASARGFTIVELLTVLAVIGILAVAAMPSFVEYLRDKRVSEAASRVVDVYRLARSRAMGRGSATLVRWDASAPLPTPTSPGGRFEMREAVAGPATPFHQTLPSTSCLAADWQSGSNTSQYVESFDDRDSKYDPAEVAFFDGANAQQAYVELCYTPRGRTFVRFGKAGSWQTLTSVPVIEVRNPQTTMRRYVVLPPNGAARLETRIQ